MYTKWLYHVGDAHLGVPALPIFTAVQNRRDAQGGAPYRYLAGCRNGIYYALIYAIIRSINHRRRASWTTKAISTGRPVRRIV